MNSVLKAVLIRGTLAAVVLIPLAMGLSGIPMWVGMPISLVLGWCGGMTIASIVCDSPRL